MKRYLFRLFIIFSTTLVFATDYSQCETRQIELKTERRAVKRQLILSGAFSAIAGIYPVMWHAGYEPTTGEWAAVSFSIGIPIGMLTLAGINGIRCLAIKRKIENMCSN